MDARVLELEEITGNSSHTHNNKVLLDTYTQTEPNLADAVKNKHSHSNKEVLDEINYNDVERWDSAEENAKAYADTVGNNVKDYTDGLNNAINDRLDNLEESNHYHDNKALLCCPYESYKQKVPPSCVQQEGQ
jgi:hypothetical protein